MALTYKEVAEILKIIDASDCDEVVLELEGTRLVVRRNSGGVPSAGGVGAPAVAASSAPVASAVATPAKSRPTTASAPDPADGTTIRSPMVGTFYSRPSPEDPPFVKQGSTVKPGDALCLIEVMKLYTTIEATTAGVISAILAEDGNLVEFDQPLFVIKEN